VRWDISALFWPLSTPQIEVYSDFPDSLSETVRKVALVASEARILKVHRSKKGLLASFRGPLAVQFGLMESFQTVSQGAFSETQKPPYC
jgi:hypothetical protein